MSDTIQSFTQSNHSYCTVKDTESSKSVSETPETDMLLSNQLHDDVQFDDACDQLAELCRSLERERDVARKLANGAMLEADRLRSELHKQLVEHDTINAERGESRGLRKAWVALDDKRQDLEQQLTAALRERDEARLKYSTTLVFCQSLVKERLEDVEGN